jgi:hypothetical protein
MSMSLVIHMLEVCVAVLSAMLAWQVARQYKLQVDRFTEEALSGFSASAVVTPQGLTSGTSDEVQRKEPFISRESLVRSLSPGISDEPLAKKESVESAVDARQGASHVSAQISGSVPEKAEQAGSALDILDDYIGGFFEDSGKSEVEIKAFRSVGEQEVESYYRSDAGNDHISAIAPAVDLTKYKASTADAAEQIPVLRTPIPESLITERFLEQVKELDEEVILVEEKQQVVSRESVMSDKVVLAMLDEAKLVGTH